MELLVLILALVNLLANTAYSSIAPIFPLAAIEKGIPNTYIGFIFSMYSLMKVIMSPFVAVLMNQTGRRAILLRGLVFEGVAIITFGVLDFIQDPVWSLLGYLPSFGGTRKCLPGHRFLRSRSLSLS